MRKTKKAKLLNNVEFKVGKGKCLIINIQSNIGLDRVVIENEKGIMKVMATGHSQFEFDDKKTEPGTCDFILRNRKWLRTLEDYLNSCFWGQFSWGKLAQYQDDKQLIRAAKAEIKKLAAEFESAAAERINALRPTQVVNSENTSFEVYIGRPTKWGNPFKINDERERDQALLDHEHWLWRQPQLLAQIGELRGKALGCHCKPKKCHGDTLVRIAEATRINYILLGPNGVSYLSKKPGKYAGSIKEKIFGRLDCYSGKANIKKGNRVFFLTWKDAIANGFRPCKICKPTPHDKY